MSYNGSGTYVVNSAGQPVVTGTTITSTAFNALTADLATALSTVICSDGQTTPSANIPFGGFKLTNIGNGTLATDAAAFGQLSSFGVPGYTTTATAAGTTVLTVASTLNQFFTGVTTQTVTLPVTSTLVLGFQFVITNMSTGVVTVNSSGGNAVVAMVPLSRVTVTCILTSGTTAASWDIQYTGKSAVTGTGAEVLSVSPSLTTPVLGVASATSLATSAASPLLLTNGQLVTVALTSQTVGGATLTIPNLASVSDTFAMGTLAQTLANKTLTTPVLTGLPTGSGVASAATASTLAARDASANLSSNSFIEGYTTTVTAAGTTTLTVGSTQQQFFTGTSTQTVVLPVTSTLALGYKYLIVNRSTGNVTVQSSGANNIIILSANSEVVVTCILTSGTSAASWGVWSAGWIGVPGNAQSAAYTTVISDSGKSIDHPAADANARTFTIDSNANVPYPVGTCICFSNMTANVVTISITSDTMYLAGAGTTGSRSLAQYGVATARKILSTTWLISGTGLT